MKKNISLAKYIPLIIFIVISVFLALSILDQLENKNSNNPNQKDLPSPFIGKNFPEIQVEDFYTGEVISMRDNFGNNVALVNVWASWCTTCRAEHQMLIDIAKDNSLKLIGINYKDKKEDANKMLETTGNPYDLVVFDPEGKIGLELGIYAIPETFLVNQQGVIIHKHIGEVTQQVWLRDFLPLI